jgi:hypothetical protein
MRGDFMKNFGEKIDRLYDKTGMLLKLHLGKISRNDNDVIVFGVLLGFGIGLILGWSLFVLIGFIFRYIEIIAVVLIVAVVLAVIAALVIFMVKIGKKVRAMKLYKKHEKQKIAEQEQQFLNEYSNSTVYIMRHSMIGLENHLGVAPIASKGFQTITAGTPLSGVNDLTLIYSRFQNLPDLDIATCGSLRDMLNSNILAITNTLPYDRITVFPIDLYVTTIKASGGKLEVNAVPMFDINSRKYVADHQAGLTQNSIVGNANGNTTAGGDLVDDEL